MADLLDLDEEPDAPQRPRLCFDERPCQLLGESRAPRPRVPGHPSCVAYDYSRPGPGTLFLMAEPLQGWRHVTVTSQRTKRELAHCMAAWVDIHVPRAEKIRVILDHLSPHTPGALYEVFPPAEARRLLRTRAFHPTPGPGSRLHRAAIELAVLARQCLNRRIPERFTRAREVAAWEVRRHRHHATLDWRFTTKDARITLQSLYPKASE